MNLNTNIHRVTKVTVTPPALKSTRSTGPYQVQYVTVTTADGSELVFNLYLEDEQSQPK